MIMKNFFAFLFEEILQHNELLIQNLIHQLYILINLFPHYEVFD